jgi:hypothetical protein
VPTFATLYIDPYTEQKGEATTNSLKALRVRSNIGKFLIIGDRPVLQCTILIHRHSDHACWADPMPSSRHGGLPVARRKPQNRAAASAHA